MLSLHLRRNFVAVQVKTVPSPCINFISYSFHLLKNNLTVIFLLFLHLCKLLEDKSSSFFFIFSGLNSNNCNLILKKYILTDLQLSGKKCFQKKLMRSWCLTKEVSRHVYLHGKRTVIMLLLLLLLFSARMIGTNSYLMVI